MDYNMDQNRRESVEFRPMPPLLPMKQSPPPLCAISKPVRGGSNSFESRHSPNFQNQQKFHISIPEMSPSHNQVPNINTTTTMTNPRKRKSENTNRELIDLVKKQLEQLNKTLAALERNNDCDDEMPLGHLTPPSDNIIDLEQGKKKNIVFTSQSFLILCFNNMYD